MANSEASSIDHGARAAQDTPVSFPTICTPVDPSFHSRPRADSQSHFRLRPALAALQNTFISRRRASSVSDAASQRSASIAHSAHLARFVGLGAEPRPRTSSTATVTVKSISLPARPNTKRHPSALDFPILESPDEAMSRAPRIPSFHMDSEFGRDLGLSLGLNPRFSTTSTGTIRAHSVSLTPEESRAVKDSFVQNQLDMHQPRVAPETLAPLSGTGSAQELRSASSTPGYAQARDATLLTSGALIPTPNPALSSSSLAIDAAARLVADQSMVATETSVDAHPAADLACPYPSHAQHENDLYSEGVRVIGGTLPASPVLTPLVSGASSPRVLRSPAISPIRSTFVSPPRSTTVSPVRSISLASPHHSVAMGTAPPSPVNPLSTSTLTVPTAVPLSPSHTSPIPFPSSEDNESYTSDDGSEFVSQYAYSRQSGCDTPALYTGTTNTSPTLSVTRTALGEVSPALRLGPGMGYAGVGTYAGGGVHGGVFFGAGDGPCAGLLQPKTGDRMEFERDTDYLLPDGSNRSINAESSGRSINAESSGQSTHAKSSRSGYAGSSSATGIRARVSSLRTNQTLSALIPAFMKRARRKSKVVRDETEEPERLRGRKNKKTKKIGEPESREESCVRAESSRVRTESSRPRTDSVSSSCAVSDDEDDISPVSSDLDLLSADPFASTVQLKVGAWSQMYASYGRRKSSSVPARDSGSSNTLPPILDVASADDRSDVHVDCSSSLYDDEESEEESSIRIYSHGRGRSLSQPDVYTIPIEPLHQSTTTRRSGSSLGGRRRRRPALPDRPSLPTLSTLTRTNVVIPMPKTTPAARFPAEPWDAISHGEQRTGMSGTRSSLATRGLGSLVLPLSVPGSPVRATSGFPRSPMRSRMGSVVGMGSESSIAEDEDEEEAPAETSALSVAGDAEAWWSNPSSRTDSRRGSFMSSAAAEDEELDEPTVSMPVSFSEDVAVQDTVASTARIRDSASGSEASNRLSQGSLDVSSDAFLQKLDELDAIHSTTPPPSDRSSSEHGSSELSVDEHAGMPVLTEFSTGAGPRYAANSAGGMYGGGFNNAGAGGYRKQGSGDGWKNGSGGQGGNGYYGAGGGTGGNGDNGPHRQPPVDSESDESSSESESDEPFARRGRDARGQATKAKAVRSQSMPRQALSASARGTNRQTAPTKGSSGDESDDVPLAQRIPTALKAQKSIRVQDKAERDERRQKRLDRMRRRAVEQNAPTGGEGGVAADELAKRLLTVKVGSSDMSRGPGPLASPRSPAPATRHPPDSAVAGTSGLFPASDIRSRTLSNVSHMTRSRTHTRNPSAEQQAPPTPSVPQVSVSRSGTMSKRRPSAPEPPVPLTSLARSGTTKSRPSHDEPRAALSRSGTAYRYRGGSKTDDEGESSRFQRSRSIRDPSGARPPMPPMPPIESIPLSARRPSQQEPQTPFVVEQRIYIGDRQKFVVVDVGSPGLTAKDILDVAKQRGELEISGVGGWQLWEQSNECGMERPVRDFELINDVLKSWNPEKRASSLLRTALSPTNILEQNIPSSSPTMSGWVMWASKPGKWSKRWLELKEHSLFVCKSDKGKDQTFLCGVSNFDAYIVTHMQRAPKGFVFAAKSTEGSGVFEKEEDSSHVFSCDREIGEVWLNKILLARSYVLQQERAVFSRPFNASSLAPSRSLLSRSGTKKSTVSSRSATSQNQGPLIQDLNPSPFVEGSLLAKAAHGM
ncbi:hypothetical protein RhiJN_20505 [Ceratobasidium sp. AG-Ba]|nr:hypothetical protein RhiJN_20505 [Ceratobasidium sp. AG-Ba]